MSYQEIDVRPYCGNLGAEIFGVDLRETISDSVFDEIHQALLENCVIFFRDQELTPEQQKAFAARFGKLQQHPYIPTLDGHPEIIELASDPDGPADMSYQSNKWHTDMTFMQEPPMGCVLYGKVIPAAGGDTMFMNLYQAFNTLSQSMQDFVATLTAVHNITASMPDGFINESWAPKQLERLHKMTPAVEHPVVRTHPESGKKCLFVNSNFTSHIKGLSLLESEALLNMLYEHMAKPENTCRFNWAPHSIAFWDNRCTQHYAVNDYHALRVMHRVTIEGDRPY